MRNIKLEIEYDGTNFSGWEIQPERKTIRDEIERALGNLLNEDIKLIGASRTDAGVHAISQIANFKTNTKFPVSKIKGALRELLSDIYVKNVAQVPLEFDARKSARSKVYFYRALLGKSPLLQNRVWEYKFPLDTKRIERAIPLFLGVHQFDLFSHKDKGECEIKNFTVGRCDDIIVPTLHTEELIFEIEANRFLRKMVRMIVGALTEIGRGKIEAEDIELALELKGNPAHKCRSAPPQGLYLKEVKY